jgi:hypothetical protein
MWGGLRVRRRVVALLENLLLLKDGCLRATRAGGVVNHPGRSLRSRPPLLQKEGFA